MNEVNSTEISILGLPIPVYLAPPKVNITLDVKGVTIYFDETYSSSELKSESFITTYSSIIKSYLRNNKPPLEKKSDEEITYLSTLYAEYLITQWDVIYGIQQTQKNHIRNGKWDIAVKLENNDTPFSVQDAKNDLSFHSFMAISLSHLLARKHAKWTKKSSAENKIAGSFVEDESVLVNRNFSEFRDVTANQFIEIELENMFRKKSENELIDLWFSSDDAKQTAANQVNVNSNWK